MHKKDNFFLSKLQYKQSKTNNIPILEKKKIDTKRLRRSSGGTMNYD